MKNNTNKGQLELAKSEPVIIQRQHNSRMYSWHGISSTFS